MANEFKIKKGLIVTGASGGTVVDIQGSQGQLFSVTDDLSGDIFAVSDISGVPIFTVNSSGLSTFDGALAGTSATFSGNVVSEDTIYLENAGGKRWQMLFATNDFNLRYYNGSSWSADAFAIDTSNNATFAGSLTIPDYIYHTSDPNTFFGFDGNDQIAIKTSGNYNFFGDANATTLYAAGNIKLKTSNVSVGTATTTGGTLIDGWITTTQANAVNNTTIATTAVSYTHLTLPTIYSV